MNTSMVVVHGASGVQGGPVARQLLAAGHRVRAVVRRGRPEAGEGVVADLLDTDALIAAYRGADAVVVQLPLVFTADLAMAQAQSVVRALRAVEVRQVVFNSGATLPPGPVGVPYVDARVTLAARLPELTPASTVVSPAATYMENLAAPWSAPKVRAGELAYPLPEGAPVPWVAVDDLTAVVVDLLATASPPSRQVVTGPKALTGDEAAAELTAALGHPVRWRSISPGEYEQMLHPPSRWRGSGRDRRGLYPASAGDAARPRARSLCGTDRGHHSQGLGCDPHLGLAAGDIQNQPREMAHGWRVACSL